MKIIYTANIGGYDKPVPLNDEFREDWQAYYFTDDKSLIVDGWQMKYVESDLSAVAFSKEIKIRPHRYFNDGEFFLWIDSTHEIIQPLNNFYQFLIALDVEKCGWWAKKHRTRICIYNELQAPRVKKKVKSKTLKHLAKFYQVKGMPVDFGLPENEVFLRQNTENVRKISNFWWQMMFKNKAYRDQIFLSYAMWRYNFKPCWFTNDEKNQFAVKKHKHLKKRYEY